MPAGEAPSLSEMEIEWASAFGDRPFSFCSLDDLPGPPVGKERYMWECRVSPVIDLTAFERVLFRKFTPDAGHPYFRYLFVRLSAGGDWPIAAWFQYALQYRGAVHRDMLGFSFASSAAV